MSVMPERDSTEIGSVLSCKHQTRLLKFARDKHSSLLQKFVNYGRKKFYNIGPGTVKLATAVIYGFIVQVLHSRVGSWPYPKTFDQAVKVC